MIKRLIIFAVVGLVMTLVQAQGSLPPLAVEYQGGLYVMNRMPASEADLPDALTLVNDTPTDNFYAVWSPDGTRLAYAVSPEGDPYSYLKALMVWDGTQSIELVAKFSTIFPIGWTRTGRIIYATFGSALPNQTYAVKMMSIAPEAGATPQAEAEGDWAGQVCGIGGSNPMENQLWNDAGLASWRPMLALTDYGLIYPIQCPGAGVGLYRLASGDTVNFADGKLVRAVLSPDETRLAGITLDTNPQVGSIVVVDLMTMAETTLTTTEPASVVAWGNDGSLYYASVSQSHNLMDGLSPEQVTQVATLTNIPDPSSNDFFRGNTVRLYRRAPDGSETLLHEQDAYAVGRLAFKDNLLVYSTIANGDAWVQALLDGSLTGDIYFAPAMPYIPISVNVISLNADGTVAQSATLPGNLQHMALAK